MTCRRGHGVWLRQGVGGATIGRIMQRRVMAPGIRLPRTRHAAAGFPGTRHADTHRTGTRSGIGGPDGTTKGTGHSRHLIGTATGTHIATRTRPATRTRTDGKNLPRTGIRGSISFRKYRRRHPRDLIRSYRTQRSRGTSGAPGLIPLPDGDSALRTLRLRCPVGLSRWQRESGAARSPLLLRRDALLRVGQGTATTSGRLGVTGGSVRHGGVRHGGVRHALSCGQDRRQRVLLGVPAHSPPTRRGHTLWRHRLPQPHGRGTRGMLSRCDDRTLGNSLHDRTLSDSLLAALGGTGPPTPPPCTTGPATTGRSLATNSRNATSKRTTSRTTSPIATSRTTGRSLDTTSRTHSPIGT